MAKRNLDPPPPKKKRKEKKRGGTFTEFQKTSGRSITNSKILYNIPNELNFLVHGQSVD